MDEFKAMVEERAGGEIPDFLYFNAVKALGEEFGVPLDCMDPIKEYWLTKDPGVLTEKAKEYLLSCKSAFYLIARREDDD